MERTHMWVRFIDFYFEIGLKYKEKTLDTVFNKQKAS